MEANFDIADELTEEVIDHLRGFSKHLEKHELQTRLFDKVLENYCIDIAAAMDAEIGVWALVGDDFEPLFLDSARHFHSNVDEEVLDEVFQRSFVSRTRQNMFLSPIPADQIERINDQLGVPVTSIISDCFGERGSLEGVISVFRIRQSKVSSAKESFTAEDLTRFNFYLEIMNRLVDRAYLRMAFQR